MLFLRSEIFQSMRQTETSSPQQRLTVRILKVTAGTILGALAMTLSLPLTAGGIDPDWQDAGNGIQLYSAKLDLFNSVQSISAVRYKAAMHKTGIVNDPEEMADSTSALALRHNAVGAVNGSYFNMDSLIPITFVKDDGIVEGLPKISDPIRTEGIVAVMNERKVVVAPCDTSAAGIAGKCSEGLASGPLLLQSGRPVRESWPDRAFYTKRHPRTIVGTDSKGWVYFIVIDGRSRGNADGATIAETLQIALEFGLKDALNLDGGGSSTLWLKGAGVISHPSDNKRFDHYGQRCVPNAVVFR